ncbi:1-deoxy-D-xylulose 5-phosphate reductoisomerase [Hypnocyclicus thermotrophus]|uniref:1-deoxy-D-xylulose 5-phosphate reductoisomerase n=1 Tax=Hypnocyclicus thermotrophus TaxID=1627895 RepID=A0AA46DYY7_9FUSO|nr:1-deoxy-D-xylulose-5-phosphate reductoisomerase [Hypnocyclicus thermotrophus]TDT70647.1 1-deoxy-D-xylulose 5-phosphate reductoisomerase [Hypnocyclicus thermotrophus]
MKNISILGSTGSIGTNALEIIRELKNEFNVIALTANSNYKFLAKQIKEFKPKYVAIGTEEGYKFLKNEFNNIEIFYGKEGLKEIGKLNETDIILTAVSGAIGLEATIEAIKKEKRIALANKETMVAGGDYINSLLKKYKAEIIPVDSEHSALFQSLLAGKDKEVKNLVLTGSGGTFRGKTIEFLKNVELEDALKHPNWSMGKKITIDSSTLINKGLEVIEAHQLFNIDYDKIKVVIHPQSIIHSMVEFVDNSIVAQMGVPDMKIPIQYAFSYPERLENKIIDRLDFMKYSNLTFEEVDNKVFRGIELAFFAGKIGKSMPIVFNAANEMAVELFLNNKIKFLDIYKIIENEMNNHKTINIDNLNVILEVDREIRDKIRREYL